MPSAVPIPAVASAPALQCVRTAGTPVTPAHRRSQPRRAEAADREAGEAVLLGDPVRLVLETEDALAGTAPRRALEDGAHPADGAARGSRRSGRADDEPLGAELERDVEIVGHARGHAARLGAQAVRCGDADQRGSPAPRGSRIASAVSAALSHSRNDFLVREAALVEEAQPPGRVRVRRHPRGGPGFRGHGRDYRGPGA